MVPCCVWACASSTPIDVSIDDQATAIESSAGPTSTSVPFDEPSGATTVPPTISAEVTTTGVPDCTGLAEVTSGARTFDHDGVPRTYRLALPRGYDGTDAVPMIVNFHGASTTAELFDSNTSMSRLAIERGFVVVTPDSTSEPQSWNVRADTDRDDDFAFAHALVAQMQQILCVDASRIYVSGHANGATFAAYLACSTPFEFAAIAMVASTTPGLCPPEVQPAVLAIAGTADEANPYDDPGGDGVVDVMTAWAQHDGCATYATDNIRDGVDATRFDGCAAGDAQVVLLTIDGGGHPWPGSPVAVRLDGNSDAAKKFDATSAILDFFAAHSGA